MGKRKAIIIATILIGSCATVYSFWLSFQTTEYPKAAEIKQGKITVESTDIFYATKETRQTSNNEVKIVLTLNSSDPSANISKAALKFDKDFAYSLTLDDGKSDAITNGLPLFAGGYSSGTGETYPGLFFTDGCGNKIEFRAGIAINALGPDGQDMGNNVPGKLTWSQIKELHTKKWDVFNHSLNHQAGPGTDYWYQVEENNNYVRNKTGIKMTHFVIPSGDGDYTSYAFNFGMKGVYNQKDFPGSDGLNVDNLSSLDKFRLYRNFLSDNNHNTGNISSKVDQVANASSPSNHLWYSEFTHHISTEPKGGSLIFSTFRHHMSYLEQAYGHKGKDNMWMAPLQEVYEYLVIRENTVIRIENQSNKVIIYVDFDNVPDDLRKYAMTFKVNSNSNIISAECAGASKVTFRGSGQHKIVNVDWPDHPSGNIAGIEDAFSLKNSCNTDEITVYPNPVHDKLSIQLKKNDVYKAWIKVTDLNGRELYKIKSPIQSGQTEINIGHLNLTKGIYLLELDPENGECVYRKMIYKN
ncbi:MAG: T9SS type A sorting domain-containing protein [Cytophagaceae bacterium]